MGILGEYDALSGLSQEVAVPVKKELMEGAPGHGRGHCALGTGALAAIAVKKYLEEFRKDGTIIYFGCLPRKAGSKQFMARAGMFDDVDFVYTWHPSTANQVDPMHSKCNYGSQLYFKGLTSHAERLPIWAEAPWTAWSL